MLANLRCHSSPLFGVRFAVEESIKIFNKLADSLTTGVNIFVQRSTVRNTNRKLIPSIRSDPSNFWTADLREQKSAREKQARTGEDAPVKAEPLLDDVSEAGREGARFVILVSANACRFAAFSSERVTLFAPMLPYSMSRVHSSFGS